MARYLTAYALGISCAIAITAAAAAAQYVPSPTRTVFKCFDVDGKVTYSDSPCPAAQTLDRDRPRESKRQTGQVSDGAEMRKQHR